MLKSLSAQTSYYQKMVQGRADWKLFKIYTDEGISGTKDNRPGFQAMLEAARAGKIDLIITKTISRFARNIVTFLEVIRELKSLGINVYFEAQRIYSISPDGELMLSLMASHAQEQARNDSENQLWSIKRRMQKGILVGFTGNLLGYDWNKKLKQNVINEREAEIVRMIFEWYTNGEGSVKIAKRLNLLGFNTKHGGKWTDPKVCSLIENEKYCGNSMLQKWFTLDYISKKQLRNRGEKQRYFVEGSHPAIISKEIFVLANKIKNEKAEHYLSDKNNDRETINRYEFSGKIICENCGKHYKHKKTKRGFSWQCSTFLMKGKAKCPAKAIPESVLQKLFDDLGGGENIVNISVPKANFIRFKLKIGGEVIKEWKDRSRAESWTKEMKEKARQDAIKGNEINKKKNENEFEKEKN
jgi:DNA invertase Pin-like site-specific DNA recombinase